MKNGNRTGLARIIVVGLALIIQMVLLGMLVSQLRQHFVLLYSVLPIIGLLEVLLLSDKDRHADYTVAWIILILLLPVFGHVLYLLWGKTPAATKRSRRTREIVMRGIPPLSEDADVYQQFLEAHPARNRFCRYLEQEGFPLQGGTGCRYFPLGEMQFEAMLEDMEKAERFIFLAYFILGDGKLWKKVHAVLKKKAEQGIDVRIQYDDFGCLTVLPKNFARQMAADGIRVSVFNPVHRHVSRFHLNYRNHQKIVVIDGNVGYTGGTNLADEYANLYEKHGHWKDTAIRLEGRGVWGLTVTFLQMWETESGEREDEWQFRPTLSANTDGYFQLFNDGPINHPHNPAEDMYLKMISAAQSHVYITTPYLILNEALRGALVLAAKSGVDVRIITPRIWDKWYVHLVTQANYQSLLESGVRIYEYAPGYIHAKTIISDGDHAVTGSINMDYRSFYLHYENGVWICGASVIEELHQDFEEIMKVSEEIRLLEWTRRPWHDKVKQQVMALFAPLL